MATRAGIHSETQVPRQSRSSCPQGLGGSFSRPFVKVTRPLASLNADTRKPVRYEASWRRRAREAFKLTRLPQIRVLHQTRDWFFELS